ncbi:hypothetical protein GKC56_07855, partial [Neisseriaceae bacterium PsAf]|nr:hypothetical protein [Neisseriaceae bacterium PsAf]
MLKRILCLGLLSALVACQNQEEPTSKEKAVNNQVTGYDRSGLPKVT